MFQQGTATAREGQARLLCSRAANRTLLTLPPMRPRPGRPECEDQGRARRCGRHSVCAVLRRDPSPGLASLRDSTERRGRGEQGGQQGRGGLQNVALWSFAALASARAYWRRENAGRRAWGRAAHHPERGSPAGSPLNPGEGDKRGKSVLVQLPDTEGCAREEGHSLCLKELSGTL